jgi:glycosyltransferase involved in cell wall biosynthesis
MGPAPGSVWVDAQGAQSVGYTHRGIGRFISEQLNALVGSAPDVIGGIHLTPEAAVPPGLEPLVGSEKLRWGPNRPAQDMAVPSLYHVASPMELTTPLEEVWPDWAQSPDVRTVVTLYDLIPLRFRDRYLDPLPITRAAYFSRLGLLRRADHLLAISQQTARDAEELLGIPERRITVIGCGVSERFGSLIGSSNEAQAVLSEALSEVRDGFVLYVGGDDPRKNLQGAIDGFALVSPEMRRAHQLVIACKMSDERIDEFAAHAAAQGIDPSDVVFTGFVSDRELAALYRSCSLFLFPSLYEGAGLPILEAMSCGAPVVASATSSIPEILGDLEGTFDPADPRDLASCLERVLTDPGLLDRLRERSAERVRLYTWDRVAELTLQGYDRALGSPSRPTPTRSRKRVAMLTPWPPQWTGVARHSRQLVEELSEHADIDVIAPAPENGLEYDRSLEDHGVGVFTAADFDWIRGLRDYDRFLYVLGGSPFHVHAFEALRRRPGAVLAHDVRLLGLYMAVQEQRHAREPNWLLEQLQDMYGHRISEWDLRRYWDPRIYLGLGVYMTADIQRHAEQMIVHAEHQRDVLRLESRGPLVPTHVLPHGIPEPPPPRDDMAGDRGPQILTLGLVSTRAKRMPLLLAGFARVLTTHPDARLNVVGELPDSEREHLTSMIAELGIGDSVRLWGRTDRADYWQALHAADLAVQLRSSFNAAASGAVSDCIAARVPAIVTAIGWATELPRDVVLPVPEDCSVETLAERMLSGLQDEDLRRRIKNAQDAYATETSFARVAERYAEVLAL